MRVTGLLNAIALAVLIIGWSAGTIVFAQTRSEGVPTYDVSRTCSAEAAVAPEMKDGCLADEQSARNQLTTEWAQYSAADRTNCSQSGGASGGILSYVELLTCLQSARDARKLPKE
jgi:hypothetical protein